jgi:4-hydroxybenzoate polyprenyltransferase
LSVHGWLGLSRWRAWAHSKLLFIAAAALLISTRPSALTILEMIATAAAAAAFGYGINDIADRASDHRAGQPNRASRVSLSSRIGFLVTTAGGALGLSLLWAADAAAPVLVGLSLTLAAAYSVAPLRLKQRGIFGLVAAAAAQWPIPVLAIAAAEPRGWLRGAAWAMAMLGLAIGMRHEAVHQRDDAAADRRAGVATYVARGGSAWKVMRASYAAELGLLGPTLALTWPRSRAAVFVLVAWFLLGEALSRGGLRTFSARLQRDAEPALATYSFCLLPVTLALSRLSAPASLGVAALLLALGYPYGGGWLISLFWAGRRQRSIRELRRTIPAGASFILIDEDRWALEGVAGLDPVPFIEHQGRYWGRPESSAHAIAELERLRRAGASFLVVAAPALWWLDYYDGLRRHLDHRRRIVDNDRLVVFDLGRRVNDIAHATRLGRRRGRRKVRAVDSAGAELALDAD